MKHIEIQHDFIREAAKAGAIQVEYTPTNDQLADFLTKPLPHKSTKDRCDPVSNHLTKWNLERAHSGVYTLSIHTPLLEMRCLKSEALGFLFAPQLSHQSLGFDARSLQCASAVNLAFSR